MEERDPIRVVVIEDNAALTHALRILLNGTPGYRCTGTFPDAESALASPDLWEADILLIDLGLPGMSGQEAIPILKARSPHLRFLVLTIKDQDAQIFTALKAGANGYLLKSATPAEILTAIRELSDGGAPMSRDVASRVIAFFHGQTRKESPVVDLLTLREQEILTLLSQGKLYKEIAAALFVTMETVKSHCHNIYEKLHVSSKIEAVNKYFHRDP